MEGLIFGILRYLVMKLFYTVNINLHFSRLKGKTLLFRRLMVKPIETFKYASRKVSIV